MTHFICTLNYYDKARKLIQTITTHEAHWAQTDTNKYLVGSRNEYTLMLSPIKDASFIEVYWSGITIDEVYRPLTEIKFIARHFQRFGQITPFVSYSEDRSECEWIKKQQIAIKPKLDGSRIISDRLMQPVKNQQELLTNPGGYLMKYKI